MKLKLTIAVCAMLLANLASAGEKLDLKTQKDKISYTIGLDMGKSLKRMDIDTDIDVLVRGIKDALAGSEPLLTDQEMRETITAMQKERQIKHQEKLKAEGEKNKKAGDLFLAENKKKDGVVTLPDGLQYKIIKNGTGKMPKATDSVTVNYRGTFVDGTEFDSSMKQGPATFKVNAVIRGWAEALKLMKEGSKWQIFVPSDLAYGERGEPRGKIGPNATLIFEVELLSINKQERRH